MSGRILKDLSGHQKLVNMAKTINSLAVAENDARLEFCRALAAAMDLVKQESNLSFVDWADTYLRKPDGSKWSLSYLYKCAMFGRNPEKLHIHRAAISEHGSASRRALHAVEAARPRGRIVQPSAATVEDEIKRLMFVWRGVSAEARKRFLELIAKRKAA